MKFLSGCTPLMYFLLLIKSKYLSTVTTISKYTVNTTLEEYIDEKGNSIYFKIKQIKHSVKYKQWFIKDKEYYTYHVTSIYRDKDGNTVTKVGHYPHMCSNFYYKTKLGHYYATIAHIERFGLNLKI